tara:strand:+ start:1934 stop:2521 length:588 start_codon:yes stop_codon:yes gene_type:complete
MAKERKAYAPFSLTSEAGVAQTPVEGYIDVVQKIYPSVTTGTINENGKWTGVRSNDSEFIGFSKAVQVADGGSVLFPDTNNHPNINMEGFKDLQFVAKSSVDGNFRIDAKIGPDTIRTLNVTVVGGSSFKLAGIGDPANDTGFADTLQDTSEFLGSGFRLFTVYDRLKDIPNMQLFFVNNTGSITDIEFAFRRLV